MTASIAALLQPIKDRLNAATPGPWHLQKCSPCTERGRLEVNLWDEDGNVLITNWCNEDPYEPSDAQFIAAAPTDQARLIAALEEVLAIADRWEDDFPHKAWQVRSAIARALGEQGGAENV